MTLTTDLVKVQYAGNGSTVEFAVTFDYWDDTDITVIHLATDGVTETTWVDGTQYSLVGGDGSTGTLTVSVSPSDYTPASGETLTIKSNRADTQLATLPVGGAFPSTSVTQSFDQVTRLIQQKNEALGRAIKFAESSTMSDIVFPEPTALYYVRWDAAGTALETVAGVSGGAFIEDADSDTKIQVEESADEDIIRFDVAGSQVGQWVAAGLVIGAAAATASILTINTPTDVLEVVDSVYNASLATPGTTLDGYIKVEIDGNVLYINCYSDIPT